jgi:hypothetical protein
MWATDAMLERFDAGDFRGVLTTRTAALNYTQEATLNSRRLALRLGREHPIYTTYDRALDVFVEMHRELLAATPMDWRRFTYFWRLRRLGRKLEGIAGRWKQPLLDARADFVDAAHAIVRVSLTTLAAGEDNSERTGRGELDPA